MNFLAKIDFLMARDGLNKNSLSMKSGIPYTTIDAFYKKGYSNVKMGTIRKIANVFDVTLDYLMDDAIIDYNHGKIAPPWHTRLTSAYEEANIHIREATCRVLNIDYVDPAKPRTAAEADAKLRATLDSAIDNALHHSPPGNIGAECE